MSRYIPKEIVLNNLEIPEGVSILYSIWTIRDKADGTIVHYTARDEVNLTSKIFTDVFEIGKKYEVIMSMVRTDGPTIDTRPLEVQVFAGDETYNLYPMPSVIDTPVITMAYALDNVPTNDIKFTGSNMIVAGNATHDYSNWWLTNDLNEVIWDSLKDQVNKTEIIVSGVDLKKDRFYTMHCVYIGTNRDSSGTGSITFRPNTFDELEIAGDLNNTYYGYGIDTRLKELNSDMTLFEYKLLGDDLELFSSSNTTGEIEINSYYAGEFIGIDLGNNTDKYIFAVKADNGMIYCIPYNASKVLKINPNTKETTLIGIDLGTGSAKYLRGVKANNGKIYCIPATAGKVLEIDPSTDTSILIGTDFGTTIDKHYHGVLHSNGKIYCPPYNANKVLEINPDTGVTTLIGTDYGASGIKYPYGVIGDNGKIYCAPYGPTVTQILEINVAGTTALIGASVGAVSGKYYTGLKANNGKIYFIPYSATKVVEIDTVALTATLIGNDLGVISGKYFRGLLASNNMIYCPPYNGSSVLLIDPNTSSTTLLNSSVSLNAGKYYSGNIAINGLLYFTSTSGVNTGQVIEINPTNNSINIINIPTNTGISMYGISIFSDNILCLIPATTRKPFILDLTKYEESKNSFLIESYSEYTLRLRITTNSSVIGWKDIKFKPKQFKVESDVWDDANIVYDNQIDVLTGKIYNYDNTTFKTPFISPAGKSYQLPNGEIILLRNNSKIGRFAFDDSKGVLRHIADLYIPQIPVMLDYNVFTFKIFNTGDILIGLGYKDYNIYHMKYDPINNTFKYLTTYTIANGGCQIYSEMHLVDNVVIFMSEGVNNSTQNIYGVHLVEQTLEVLATDIIANSKNGNLIRIDANTLLVRAGVNKTTNTLLNNGKLLTLDIVGPTINLTITTDNRITLPSVELANNTALQATLKNNKVILKQFSPLELKSSDLTVVKYVYGDIEVVTADYSKGVVYGNKKYYAPRNSSRVMVVDLTTGVSSFIGADLGLTVDKYFYGVVADNDKIYFIPVNASKVLEVDPSTDTVTLIGDDLGSGTNKYHRPILASNGKIYCPPVNATQVLMINPSTPTATVISIILAATIRKYFTAITHTNGMIYCPPVNAGQVLKINPNTDTVSLVGTDLGAVVGKYYKSIVADNDRIYCTPLNASRVLEINPNDSDSTILIGDDLGIDNGKYVNGVLKGTDIYYAPLNTTKVLKVDTALTTAAVIGDDLTSIYDMGTMYDPTRVYSRYYAGLLADNGNIYYAPVYASKVLEINTTLDTTLLVGKTVGGFNMYVSGLKATNGKLYFIPYNTPDCLEVDPAGINNLIHSLNILATDKNSSAASNPFTYKSIGGDKFQFTIYLNNGKRVFMSYTKDNPKMLIYR